MKARPVTVLKLEERDFLPETRLTGFVSLYREEKVGFEVAGRVLTVLDLGREVEGPAFDEDGKQVRPGDVIGRLDHTRYRFKVEALQASLAAARHTLQAAEAALKLARQTLDRQKQIFEEGAGMQQAVDDAQSNFDSKLALKAQREAEVRQINEDLMRAREDLADTTLRAPFSGRITRIHVSQGAVIESGTPIVTLSLMDPIQVQVEVSADDDRRIQTGDRAVLYPKDPSNPDGTRTQVNAIVYEKGAVADPEKRTFRIDLIARNERRLIHQIDSETKDLPVVVDFLPVVRRYRGEEGALFVHTDTVYRENGKSYVLRLPGVSFHPGARRSAVGKHIPDKVEITLGDDYITVINWNFRSLRASGDLREGDFLVLGPKKEHLEGLVIGRPQWLLRPGDLVPVRFLLHATSRGLYVPVNAITMVDGKHVVFVVENKKAHERQITVHETFREFRRIEGEGIQPGTQVIVSGVHYVSDGQPVTIVGDESLKP
jgi:RND family efflux transporter MFP subunit